MSLAEWQRCQRWLWVFRYLKIIESDTISPPKVFAERRARMKEKEKSFVYQATKSWWPRQIIKFHFLEKLSFLNDVYCDSKFRKTFCFPLKTYCCCFCFAAVVTGLQLSYDGLVSLKANEVLLWFLKFVRFDVTLASIDIANIEKNINVFTKLFFVFDWGSSLLPLQN